MERLGLWERTVVIVTSDHGEALYEHGHIGHIVQLYEESIRVPLIIRFPRGAGPAGIRLDPMVSIVDLAPTIADVFAALGKGRSGAQFQGVSLLPVISGAPGRSEVFSRSSYDQPRYALRDDSFKYIFNTATGREELYRIRHDPGERNDLAGSEPLELDLRRQALFAWILEQRRAEAGAAERAELTPEQLENLRALGYVH
jgi:arylsulfatase A-like enzyme